MVFSMKNAKKINSNFFNGFRVMFDTQLINEVDEKKLDFLSPT